MSREGFSRTEDCINTNDLSYHNRHRVSGFSFFFELKKKKTPHLLRESTLQMDALSCVGIGGHTGDTRDSEKIEYRVIR